MGRDPIWRLLLHFSGPAIAAQVVGASYNLVDAIFVGLLGTDALAALAVSNPLMMIYWSIGVGIAVGAGSLVARRLGAARREEASKAAGCSIALFLMVSSVATVVFLLFLEPLLRLFGADDLVLSLAKDYMRIECSFIPLNILLGVLAELVRVQGGPAVASAAMITSGVMNCIWDPILMWGFGPIPGFGIAGAAMATSVGRAIGVAMLLVYFGIGKSVYQFKPSYFVPDPRIVAEIYRVGVSMTLRISGGSISQIIAARTASSFGAAPLATLGVLNRASGFAFTPCMGIGQGMLPLVGYNYAAQKKDRVGEVTIKASLTGFLWGTLCWVVAMFFSVQVMSLFSTEPDFLAVATPAFEMYAYGFFTVGLQFILGFFFQGIGSGVAALLVTTSRTLIFLIPCLLIMPRIFGLTGLWASYPVADALSLVFSLIFLRIAFRNLGIPFRLRYNQSRTQELAREHS